MFWLGLGTRLSRLSHSVYCLPNQHRHTEINTDLPDTTKDRAQYQTEWLCGEVLFDRAFAIHAGHVLLSRLEW